MHVLELGAIEQNIAKQAMRAGEQMPERIANAPELKPGLQLYLQAFFDLDAERTHALSLTPIPWTSIKAYAEFYALDLEQTEDLLFLIRRMDNAHLQRLAKKNGGGK
ncbi:MAG: hypothetical protein GOVbin2380_22 [Prokaryotic dsDNA virus sp.]|uniref:phage tail assembly chaperone n=1 Tax=Methylophaga sp. TaxID=2024840 RepID=UPI0011894AA2|nr:hypothetical protein [Methylophaga sp.]QDP56587.1 MAG: hypothetical protein GOVbin2380_22 [Prokaryotic dsDNA virus sp.]